MTDRPDFKIPIETLDDLPDDHPRVPSRKVLSKDIDRGVALVLALISCFFFIANCPKKVREGSGMIKSQSILTTESISPKAKESTEPAPKML